MASRTVNIIHQDGSAEGVIIATGRAASNGAYSLTPSVGLADGTYQVVSQIASGSRSLNSPETLTLTIDTVDPVISSIGGPLAGTYAIGEKLVFTVNASENLTVTGTPQLGFTLDSGALVADYVSGDGTDTLVFEYTVKSGDVNVDGLSISDLGLNSGTIKDVAGGDLDLTLNNVGTTASILVDGIAPTITAPRITLSGATGLNGAFKIDDTVTATWNNTSGGDGNDDVASVLVDFSAFGGGASVAATNTSGSWVATSPLGGTIDATARNVSVTATDTVGNVATLAGTTDDVVDNITPIVTAAGIAISGATGGSDGSIFKIDDDVTVTWNGDANTDTISGVTVDFSDFGGGTAVVAVQSGTEWVARFPFPSGTVAGDTFAVAMTVTDDAGNSATAQDDAALTLDNVETAAPAGINLADASNSGDLDATVLICVEN